MAEEYTPPLSPSITWTFSGTEYAPPLSPSITFTLGADEDGEGSEKRKSSYMLLLTM